MSGGNCLERRARTNLCPGDDARLDDHFGLDAEVLRFPQDEVGERSDGDLADEMTDAMSYRSGRERRESVNACKDVPATSARQAHCRGLTGLWYIWRCSA